VSIEEHSPLSWSGFGWEGGFIFGGEKAAPSL